MWNYVAFSMRPDGAGLLNNDGDRNQNRRPLLRAAERYDRPDWTWIAKNGREGEHPSEPPSTAWLTPLIK